MSNPRSGKLGTVHENDDDNDDIWQNETIILIYEHFQNQWSFGTTFEAKFSYHVQPQEQETMDIKRRR